MPARKKLDISQLAKSVVDQATGEAPKIKMATPKQIAGSKGGKQGGKARMDAMTEAEKAKLSALGVAARKKAPVGVTGAKASVKR